MHFNLHYEVMMLIAATQLMSRLTVILVTQLPLEGALSLKNTTLKLHL